jgi:hypothetical protein
MASMIFVLIFTFYSINSVGVGFDTKGAGFKSCIVKDPNTSRSPTTYVIEDSREGTYSLKHSMILAFIKLFN